MANGKRYDDYYIDGINLMHRSRFVDETNDVEITNTELVMNKWAFIMCFEEWILGERKAQIEQERRREQLEQEEREWKENLAKSVKQIEESLKKGSVDSGIGV